MNCLLCESPNTTSFGVEKKPARRYYHCACCDMIFVAPQERLTPELEKARYDLHQNESTTGYRSFLFPLLQELRDAPQRLGKSPDQLRVLDYGCGPTAFLANLLREHVCSDVSAYDPFYFPDAEVLKRQYDIITSTEVWEHFHRPQKEIARLVGLLKKNGLLAVMTSAHSGVKDFHDWHYRRDLTHVVFYSEKTMQWIAAQHNLGLITSNSPYWIFQKGPSLCP